MDKIDVQNFGKNLVLAMARCGTIQNAKDAAEAYVLFNRSMRQLGQIDPEVEDDDDEDE